MSVRVKICGVASVADATVAIQCGADLIGLNFYPPSPRAVDLPTALTIRAVIPAEVWCVGIFVNASRELITSHAEQLALNAIQFHGDEEAADLQGWSCPTIKVVRLRPNELWPDWTQLPADYLLLDTYRPGRYGGTGETFSWDRVATFPFQHDRLILAGGLTPENVAEAVRAIRPWAVDVASGVESAPGRKDPEKIRAFITNAKTA